ncbi:hypothetical protein Ahy_B10g103828 [Arachis hypogaea]|uniref:PB1-like domain-containing protein n=1 Tax=Arachis hypogaea TaxID=3818 RepID=A0A444X474_ARAHY|nr:hypothetical protein Ahy_B10g103828 [Arachis hypogaea]
MDNDITIVIHHGGRFETKKDGEVVYVGDHIEQLFGLEEDTIDTLGYDNLKECWWLAPGRPLKTRLRELSHDKELLEMCFHAKNNEGVVHVYLEHGISEPEGDEVPQLIPMTPNPKTLVSETTSNLSSCIPNTPLGQNTFTSPEQPTRTIFSDEPTSNTPGQPNSAPPAQPNSAPQAQPTSNHPAQLSPSYSLQPKPTIHLKPSPPQSLHPSPPPLQLQPSLNQCLFPYHSIPTTTTKKSTTSIIKNSKFTPRKCAVKKYTIPPPRRVTRSASRFASKGKKVPTVTLLSSDSSDSYKSAKDALYRPGPEAFENSSDDDSDSKVAAARTREQIRQKHKICLEDLCDKDDLIVQNSDEKVDLGQVIGKVSEVQAPYDIFDAYHDDSDGNDSWQSEEMNTLPNSDKEWLKS